MAPLHAKRSPARVRALLEQGADPNVLNHVGETPLFMKHCAASIRALLEYGADPHARDAHGRTPLHAARSADVARVLLEHGADPHARDNKGMTPLHLARSAGVARALLAYGADPRARDPFNRAPLNTVRLRKVVQVLLAHGANPNADVPSLPTHLWKPRVVRDLLARGANARVGHLLCYDMPPETARLLLAAGADPCARAPWGTTPLHMAFDASLLALMLARGANPNALDHEGRTPLYKVTDGGHRPMVKCVRVLLGYGADPRIWAGERCRILPELTREYAAAGFAFPHRVFSLGRLCAKALRVARVDLERAPRGIREGVRGLTI